MSGTVVLFLVSPKKVDWVRRNWWLILLTALTIIATIFIPLTFIAGVYGMNFEHMPELGWRHGYPVAIGLMVLTCLTLYVVFKRRNWL